jgi:hypothetical protein
MRISSRAGLDITEGSAADLAAWHTLYRETAERDGFTGKPRPTSTGCTGP